MKKKAKRKRVLSSWTSGSSSYDFSHTFLMKPCRVCVCGFQPHSPIHEEKAQTKAASILGGLGVIFVGQRPHSQGVTQWLGSRGISCLISLRMKFFPRELMEWRFNIHECSPASVCRPSLSARCWSPLAATSAPCLSSPPLLWPPPSGGMPQNPSKMLCPLEFVNL